MNTCFFIGHRNAPESLRGRLATEVERHIVQWNVSHFIVGGYGSFDRMAASIVKAAKVKYPHKSVLSQHRRALTEPFTPLKSTSPIDLQL